MTFASRIESERGALTNHCRALMRGRGKKEDFTQAVEDLVQTTLLNAWRGQWTYDPRKDLRLWLFGIARNAHTDVLRKDRRCDDFIGEIVAIDCYEFGIPDEKPTIESQMLAETDAAMIVLERVRIAMDVSTPDQRRLVMLVSMGLTAADIAEMTGAAPADILRGLRKVRKVIEDELADRSKHDAFDDARNGPTDDVAGCAATGTPETLGELIRRSVAQAWTEAMSADRRSDDIAGRGPQIPVGSDSAELRERRDGSRHELHPRDAAEPIFAA